MTDRSIHISQNDEEEPEASVRIKGSGLTASLIMFSFDSHIIQNRVNQVSASDSIDSILM